MGLLDRFREKPAEIRTELSPVSNAPAIGNTNIPNVVGVGRKSTGATTGMLFAAPSQTILPPPTAEEDWRTFTLDERSFDSISPARILELLADLSPEVSKAVWDYLRECNAGWDFEVYKPGGKTIHKEGRRIITETLDNWAYTGGSLDVIFNRINMAALLRGALFTESVFDTDQKTSIELATPDPISARFKKIDHPIRKDIWQLGQFDNGRWIPLDYPTVIYLPVDPFTASPYGRPICAPAIFTGMFMLGLLHDLRRVIAQQGYPRIDISIDTEILLKLAPPDVRQSADKLKSWLDDVIRQIETKYAGLDPSDAYIHVSAIKLNDTVGALGTESLGAIGVVIQALERMSIRALKTMPLLMAVMEGASDANSNRQWEIQVQGIKSIQHLSEHMMQRHLSLVLRANGIRATPVWRFAELRSSEALRDAQTEVLALQNIITKYTMGWESQDASSIEATGHLPDKPEPRIPLAAPTGEPPPNANDENVEQDGSSPDPQTARNLVPFRRDYFGRGAFPGRGGRGL